MDNVCPTTYVLRMKRYSHHFTLDKIDPFIMRHLYAFTKIFEYHNPAIGNKSNNLTQDPKIYAIITKGEFRFHVNQYILFIQYMDRFGYGLNKFEIIDVEGYEPTPSDFKIKDIYQDRPHQTPVVEYLTSDKTNNFLVPLRTGEGKGYCSMRALSVFKERTVIILKAGYIEKWVAEFIEKTTILPEAIVTVQGGYQLMCLIDAAKQNQLFADVIIIGNKTMLGYLNEYLDDPGTFNESDYGCHPDDFFPLIKAGTLLIDEVHMEFHITFKILLFTHIKRVIGLSATLINKDSFIQSMYDLVFPKQEQYVPEVLDNYVYLYPISYNFLFPSSVKTSEYGSTLYSHAAFEKYVMRKPHILRDYFAMIKWLVDDAYISRYVAGAKLGIYVSTRNFATLLLEYLKPLYPHLDIRRYTGVDPYKNVIEPDIRVSTIASFGAAIDVPGLTTIIQTVSVDSWQANAQTLGRLRDLKHHEDPELQKSEVRYYYLYCTQINKHVRYHNDRVKFLNKFVKNIVYQSYLPPIGRSHSAY